MLLLWFSVCQCHTFAYDTMLRARQETLDLFSWVGGNNNERVCYNHVGPRHHPDFNLMHVASTHFEMQKYSNTHRKYTCISIRESRWESAMALKLEILSIKEILFIFQENNQPITRSVESLFIYNWDSINFFWFLVSITGVNNYYYDKANIILKWSKFDKVLCGNLCIFKFCIQ